MKRKDILSNYGGLKKEIQNKSINEIKSIEENSTSQIEQIKAQTRSLTSQKNNLNSEIKKIGGKSVDIPQIDQNVIKRIRTSYAKRIQPLKKI